MAALLATVPAHDRLQFAAMLRAPEAVRQAAYTACMAPAMPESSETPLLVMLSGLSPTTRMQLSGFLVAPAVLRERFADAMYASLMVDESSAPAPASSTAPSASSASSASAAPPTAPPQRRLPSGMMLMRSSTPLRQVYIKFALAIALAPPSTLPPELAAQPQSPDAMDGVANEAIGAAIAELKNVLEGEWAEAYPDVSFAVMAARVQVGEGDTFCGVHVLLATAAEGVDQRMQDFVSRQTATARERGAMLALGPLDVRGVRVIAQVVPLPASLCIGDMGTLDDHHSDVMPTIL